MHQNFGLGQGAINQQLGNILPEHLLRSVELYAQFMFYIPVWKQFQLATQQRDVITRQRRNHRQLLKSQQRL
ncbi:hypothetical protein D3C81_2128940 [compost metagenome]